MKTQKEATSFFKFLKQKANEFIDEHYSNYALYLYSQNNERRLLKLLRNPNKYNRVSIVAHSSFSFFSTKQNKYPFIFYLISDNKKDLLQKMLEPEHGSKAASKHKDFVLKVLTHNSNPLGVSPLTFCAINNFFDLAEVLEEHGGSIHYPGQNNNSILHYIGAHGDVDGLHFCLKKQCDINAENNQGETPIFMAILKENAHMVSEMIENGAKLDKESKNGYTPLHQAVETENEELVKIIKDRFPKRSLSKRVNPFLVFTYFSVFYE